MIALLASCAVAGAIAGGAAAFAIPLIKARLRRQVIRSNPFLTQVDHLNRQIAEARAKHRPVKHLIEARKAFVLGCLVGSLTTPEQAHD